MMYSPSRRLLLRFVLLFVLAAGAASAAFVQSVDFPYYAYPRQFWERELVWLKNIGIRNVSFSSRPGSSDALRAEFSTLLKRLSLSSAPAPQPVFAVSALSPDALALSREFLSKGTGSLLWTDVEDTVSPAFHKGAIAFNGEEQPTLSALRRNAALLQYWGGWIDSVTVSAVRPVNGKMPSGVMARQLTAGAGGSAIDIVNRGESAFHGDLRVFYPSLKRGFVLPGVEVPANEALWLPVDIQLNKSPLCRECTPLGNGDQIVYATAELTGVEYENGILAMEFAAPVAGEVVLQLSSEPSGPLLAAAKPTNFDWDDKTSRVRLGVPAGAGPTHRVRIALAIGPPDSSAFLVNAKSLIIGQTNRIATSYSSEEIAKRSRLKLSADWNARREVKSPLEIDYLVDVPGDRLHGDYVEVEIETDGARMSHARMQLLRPASLRVREAVALHFGAETELPVMPALVSVDQKAGREIGVVIRNNFPEIRNYTLELEGAGLEFSPAKLEVSVGASMERDVSVRVFADRAEPGLHAASIRLSGPANVEQPARFLVIPRGETVAYSADFDQDGRPEYVVESQKARAVFTGREGGRWLEFVWKDSGLNVLPEAGMAVGTAAVSLRGAELTIESAGPLPPGSAKGGLKTMKKGDISLDVRRIGENRAVYSLSR